MNKMFVKVESELKAQKKTKVWLASRLGESTQTLNNWKARGIPAAKVKAIALALGVRREWLEGDVSSTNEHQASYQDSVLIKQMSAIAGMGAMVGIDGDHDTVINTIEVSKQYLASQLGTITSPGNLRLIAGIGDSMRGVFKSGDTLFVDTGVTSFVTEGTYVFHFDDHVWIKQLARNGKGGYTIISTNKRYKEVDIPKGSKSFKVIGMVLGVLNLKKLV